MFYESIYIEKFITIISLITDYLSFCLSHRVLHARKTNVDIFMNSSCIQNMPCSDVISVYKLYPKWTSALLMCNEGMNSFFYSFWKKICRNATCYCIFMKTADAVYRTLMAVYEKSLVHLLMLDLNIIHMLMLVLKFRFITESEDPV
jgi:hypothetical protein